MNMRDQWPVLPVVVGLACGLLTGCGSGTDDAKGTGRAVVMGMSDDVLATDPASGYDPGSWLLFDNVFQSLLSFPNSGTQPEPELAKSCAFADARATVFIDTYGARPSKAKAAKALSGDGITGKVELTLWSTPARYGPATDAELRAVADQLNASGLFDAGVKSVDFGQYEKDIAAGKYGVYVKGWVPDYPDADNFTAPFFGKDNVLSNGYANKRLTGTLLPATAAQSDRAATDKDFAQLQDIVADQLPLLPVWQAKQYAVARDGVYGLENCLDASTVFRFWELSKS
ncbi:ABC transporter substrate-binding protein [Streptomyces sp. NPDC058459]|uniref:ABC transporter substrate-binding protein n=1 Tax=Streptomyces sp. NPDC058459 TaxID=3346508 RepID=UPI0036533434